MNMLHRHILVLVLFFPLTLFAQQFNTDSIEHVVSSIESNGQLVQTFVSGMETMLPVGIKRTIGNIEYTLAVSEIRSSALDRDMATLFLRIHLPSQPAGQNKIYFAASGVPLSRNGGLQGDVKLALVAPYTFPLGKDIEITLLGAMADGTIVDGSTSATVSCDGFKELALSAEITFSETLLKPANGSAKVTSKFHTVVKDWHDLLVDISLPPFEVPGLSDWVFSVENAVIELS